ncbi:MAG: deoxyribose-phosphate aldolase [Halobacteria archaeon]
MIEDKIDHTVLDKKVTMNEVRREIELAVEYGTNVCLPPIYVPIASEIFEEMDYDGEIVTVVGFPLGYSFNEVKVLEAEIADAHGATEIDVTANLSALKSGDYEEFSKDVETLTDQDYENVDTVKLILETGLLTTEEMVKGARLAKEAGVDYVKTSTGFMEEGATVEAVESLADTVGDELEIKASGGISSYSEVESFLDAGATRIGASSGIDIVREFEKKE